MSMIIRVIIDPQLQDPSTQAVFVLELLHEARIRYRATISVPWQAAGRSAT